LEKHNILCQQREFRNQKFVYRDSATKPEGMGQLIRSGHIWEVNITTSVID